MQVLKYYIDKQDQLLTWILVFTAVYYPFYTSFLIAAPTLVLVPREDARFN